MKLSVLCTVHIFSTHTRYIYKLPEKTNVRYNLSSPIPTINNNKDTCTHE